MPRIEGIKVHEIEGIEIYVNSRPAKRKGLDRIWIHIRQKPDKPWRMGAALAYSRAADIRFERERKTPTQI
jgi:hypothetical protein